MTSKRQLTEDSKTKETQPKPTETSKKRKEHSSDETSGKNEKLISKEERRLQKAQRKDEKTQLLEQIPKVDSNGIAYTKIQIRRMMRRVKNGLHPVPTEEEERQMKQERKREKQMEENELAGILYDRKTLEDPMDDDDDDNENNDDNDDGNDEQQEDEDVDLLEKDDDVDEDVDDEEPKAEVDSAARHDGNPKKKPKSLKPVPSDYICQACQNKHTPIHWIYDCPDKIHRPGCNKLTKKERGIHIPSERKVFVSGLPFDWKHKDVVDLFLKECGAVVEHCKVLMFEDTKRCKGQAFVTFDNEESAKKGLKLHGKALESLNKKSDQDGNSRKQLTLGVTKVQNRRK